MTQNYTTIETLDDAIGKVVRCTDGETRILHEYGNEVGHYSVPISDTAWMRLGGTYLGACRRLFIGGITVDEQPTPQNI